MYSLITLLHHPPLFQSASQAMSWSDREEEKRGDEEDRRKKSEAFVYLVTSKTVLICSETLQRKKNMVQHVRLEKYLH